MYMSVHPVLTFLIFLLILSSNVYSASTGIDIKPIDSTKKTSFDFSKNVQWITSHIWILILIIGIIFGIIIFLYIWKKVVAKIDPFFENWKKTKELCKINKRWSVKDVYRVSGNSGLSWLGDYQGDCILEDGSINIMWSNWKWGFFGKLIRWILFFLRPLLKLFKIGRASCRERV